MEIHTQIVEGYGEGADEENVRKWCWLFKDGCGCMNSLSGKFLSILHAVPTLHKMINTCCSTAGNFWPAKSVSDQEWGGTHTHCAGTAGRLGSDLLQQRHIKANPMV